MKEFIKKYYPYISAVFTFAGFGISFFLPSENQLYAACFVVFFTIIWLSFLFGQIFAKKEIIHLLEKPSFIDALVEFFEKKSHDKMDEEVIRWGLSLSTPLRLSQKYEIRRKVGEYVEIAAIHRDNYDALLKVLLDEIGWTSVELLDYTYAKEKLIQAEKLALKLNESYSLAKCYRHLFGLYFRKVEIIEAELYLTKSYTVTVGLKNGTLKNKLLAEYFYAKSTLELYKKNFVTNQ